MGWRSKSENRRPAVGDSIENILAANCLCRGNLSAQGAFRLDGRVEGSVESLSAVVIGEGGAVHGDVRGSDIVVAGHVHGNVVCSGHLEIRATGKIEGNIDASSVRIETGGIFRGTSHMGPGARAEIKAIAATEAPVTLPPIPSSSTAGIEEDHVPPSLQGLTPLADLDEVPPYAVEISKAS